MSLGWRYCTICKEYRKWQEAPPSDWLDCDYGGVDHDPIKDTDVKNFVSYDLDDRYDEAEQRIQELSPYVICYTCGGHGCRDCSFRGTKAIPMTELYDMEEP